MCTTFINQKILLMGAFVILYLRREVNDKLPGCFLALGHSVSIPPSICVSEAKGISVILRLARFMVSKETFCDGHQPGHLRKQER